MSTGKIKIISIILIVVSVSLILLGMSFYNQYSQVLASSELIGGSHLSYVLNTNDLLLGRSDSGQIRINDVRGENNSLTLSNEIVQELLDKKELEKEGAIVLPEKCNYLAVKYKIMAEQKVDKDISSVICLENVR